MKLLLALLLLTPVPGMAQKAEIQFDESANFAAFKTFRIGATNVSSKAPALNNDLVKKKIENEIRMRLKAKGLTETQAMPDVLVRSNLGANQKVDATAVRGARGRVRGVVRDNYAEGTLVIEMLERTGRDLIWQAVVTDNEQNPSKVADKVDEMVKKAFDKYPPKK